MAESARPETREKKKFKLTDVILSVTCVVFVAEAVAPVTAIGNSQYLWWIFLILTFLLPYGLIASELGTTYDGKGGLYDWVRKAFGAKWGTRVSWYYWISFPLWTAFLTVVYPNMFSIVIGHPIGVVPSPVIELAFIWVIVAISSFPVCDSVWALDGAALIKMLLTMIVGGLGMYGAVIHGVADQCMATSLMPSFDARSLSFISAILFNFLGFEVVRAFANNMENPKEQIPQAIVSNGPVIAVIYIFSAFGIDVAIPTAKVSTSNGLVNSLQLLTGETDSLFTSVMAVMFVLTLFGDMIPWSLEVSNVASCAAEQRDMPEVFAKESVKNGMPVGTAMMNGIVTSVVIILTPILPDQDLFWNFFALNLVMFLLAYLLVFLVFLRLRSVDPETERPFKVGGSKTFLRSLTAPPMITIVISLIFIAVPMSFDAQTLNEVLPITISSVVSVGIGETLAAGKCKVTRAGTTAGMKEAAETERRRAWWVGGAHRKKNERKIFYIKTCTTTPKQDSFRVPGEFEPHEGCWIIWPGRPDNWRLEAKPAQEVFAEVTGAISHFEPVTVCVSSAQYDNVRCQLPEDVRVMEMSADDSWTRDCGPAFMTSGTEVRGVDWPFSAWGGLIGDLYFPWDKGDHMARKVCGIERKGKYRLDDFILEDGPIHVDGEGTLIVTKECLLSGGGNSRLTREEIKDVLREYLNLEKIIWVPHDIYNDETSGHVDNTIRYIVPGQVILTWTDDKDNPQCDVCQKAYEVLRAETDAKGRELDIHKLTLPKNILITRGESEGVDAVDGTLPRMGGDRLTASYASFYITNGGVVFPIFRNESGEKARKTLEECFPGREMVGIYAREILLGGGNIRCIT